MDLFLADVTNVFSLQPDKQSGPCTPFLGKESTRMSLGFSNGMMSKEAARVGRKHKDTVSILQAADSLLSLYSETNYIEHHMFIPPLFVALMKASDFTDHHVWQTLLKYCQFADNWASVDKLCLDLLGRFPAYDAPFVDDLYEFSRSSNLYLRRFSVVILCRPCRTLPQAVTVALDLATFILGSKENLLRKTVAWICKESSKSDQQQVYQFLLKNYEQIMWGTLNDAMSKLNNDMRRELTKLKKG
ncbi:hypothetical protein RCL1_003393 [Eukaryota sp. TZLM3-RCL]